MLKSVALRGGKTVSFQSCHLELQLQDCLQQAGELPATGRPKS